MSDKILDTANELLALVKAQAPHAIGAEHLVVALEAVLAASETAEPLGWVTLQTHRDADGFASLLPSNKVFDLFPALGVDAERISRIDGVVRRVASEVRSEAFDAGRRIGLDEAQEEHQEEMRKLGRKAFYLSKRRRPR